MPEVLWRVRFVPSRLIPTLPRLNTLASDRVTSTAYHIEGRFRKGTTACLFQYTLSGCGKFLDSRGEHNVPAGAGFLCRMSNPETAYWYPPDASVPWIHMFMTFQGITPIVEELTSRFGSIFQLPLEGPLVGRLQGYQRYSGSTLEISPGESMQLASTVLAALLDSATEATHETPHAWLVREARRVVGAHLEENFNVSDVADALRVTPEHLCRVFRSEVGMTPLAFLTQEKIRRACECLRDTPTSCKEIGTRLGYDNASHFARTFRRVMGTTPREFRRQGGILAI